MTCIPKSFTLILNRIAPIAPVFSFLRASLFIIGILFISLNLSAQTPQLEITIIVNQNVSCFGGSDGQATAVTTGGDPPYNYLWNNGQTTATATGLTAGINSVVVKDVQDISIQVIVPITQPTAIVATIISMEATCNQLTGTITVYAFGGTGSFEYKLAEHTEWQASNIFENLAPGMYKVIVRDAAGCIFTLAGIEVGNIPGPDILNYYSQSTTYGLQNGSIEIVAEGSVMPLEYSITGDSTEWQWQSSPEFVGLAAGQYVAWVMDANGCEDSLAFEIIKEVEARVNIRAAKDNHCMNVPVELPVEGSNLLRISSFHMELEFDKAVLSYNSLTSAHPLLPENGFNVKLTPSGNILLIEFDIAPSSVTMREIQTLFRINFVALRPGESELEWRQPYCKIFESAGNQVPDFYVDGKVIINSSPVITATGSGEYCPDDELTLKVDPTEEGVLYTWTSPTGDTHQGAVWYLSALGINDNGQFMVTAVNEFTCRDEKTMDVVVTPCTINMLLPNAFTPGTDGTNDEFKPIATPGWEPGKYLMQIFNRWGEQVFETYDFNEGWDGTYKGVLVSPGLYRYVIVFDASSNESSLISSPIYGNVMVVR